MSNHSEASKREVIRLRAGGMSFSQIAAETRVSRSAAHYIVSANDKACPVATDATPAPNPGVPFPPSALAPGLASQAIELRKAGLTNQAIATRLGVSITDVAPWTYGVPKAAIKKPDLHSGNADERKRAEIIRLAQAHTVSEIAGIIGVTRARISEILKQAGVKAQPSVRSRQDIPNGDILADRLEGGETLQGLADDLRCSPDTIRRRIEAAGVSLPERAKAIERKHTGGRPQKLFLTGTEIHALVKSGTTIRQIAESAGVVPNAVYNRLTPPTSVNDGIAADDDLLPAPPDVVEMIPDLMTEYVRTTQPAVDLVVADWPAYEAAASRIPASEIVARHIDHYGIDSAQERWIDMERDQLLSMWRTVQRVKALDEAEAEAAAPVAKPSWLVRVLRFIGLR